MQKVYRVEKPGSSQGLWYTSQKVLQPVVQQLGLACATLPMDFDPEYGRDGISWYSGCSEISDLLRWFSPKELSHMSSQGYKLFLFETSLVRDYGGHQIFSKEHSQSQKEFDLLSLLKG